MLLLFSQDYGMQWIQGDVPVSIMDFRNDTIQFHYVTNSDATPFFIGTANICDREGNFQFFTNGIAVYDRYGNIMPNGDTLSFYNYGYWLSINSGAPNDQAVMILPKPNSSNLYYIFHFVPIDTGFTYAGYSYNEPTHFYYSLVDMNANFGLGDVIEKDVRLPLTGVNCASKMTAVKHANGRDWWIIRHGWRDNKYIKFLLTPDTILGPYFQNIGPPFNQNGRAVDFYGTSVFNSDGTKMASANYLSPIVVLDFDRCSGEFSNPLVINNKARDTTLLGAIGLSFSPGGRFLYANLLFELNQYDLQSPTPNDSIRIFSVDTTDAFWLHQHRLGPNGKIYIGTWNGGNYHLHVINDPDSLGLACNFQFQGQQCLTSNTYNLPNMVNYKLGPLTGSGCDTIVSDIADAPIDNASIKINPNPAVRFITITGKQHDGQLQLLFYNALGALVETATVVMGEEISVSDLPNGVYQVCVKRNSVLLQTTRLVISR
ncbi:MAG: T9SS type A sorting domain-containing protein [Chitinophagales bacterium]